MLKTGLNNENRDANNIVMNKIVIFCDNYTQVFRTLYFASSKKYSQVTIIITQRESLYEFFKAINERVFGNRLDVIFPAPYESRVTKAWWGRKLWYIIRDIFEHRRYLNHVFTKYFSGIEGAEVIFGSGYTGLQVAFFKKIARNNSTIFLSPEPFAQLKNYTPRTMREWITLIMTRLIYGLSAGIGQVVQLPSVKAYPYLTDKMISTYAAKVNGYQETNEMMKGFNVDRYKIFGTGQYKVIYFHEDIIEADYSGIDEEVANCRLTQIFNILRKYFTEKEMATKFTPGNPPKDRVKIGEILPAYVPAELFYNDGVKIYLSIFSNSIANVEKGLAVSLSELIEFQDEKIKEQLKRSFLQRIKSNVLFPKTLDEFEKIIIDLTN